MIGRLGGDEFVVLITCCTIAHSNLARGRLRAEVDAFNRARHRSYEIRFSVGEVADEPRKHRSIDALLGGADALTYERKRRLRAT